MPNQPAAGSFTGRFRYTLTKWQAYQDLCASEGTDPSKDLRGYVDRRLRKAGRWPLAEPRTPARAPSP